MKEFWDDRYGKSEYAYGTAPNDYFKRWIDSQSPGSILFPCEGEGRNAVYAASKGWDVYAFDYSSKAKEKAIALANLFSLIINYEINDALLYKNPVLFDAVVLIFAHFQPVFRQNIHQRLINMLKSEGIILLEAFHIHQIENQSGGPKTQEMLYSLKDLKSDFASMKILSLENEEIQLYEGRYHEGKADVVRMMAQKN